MTSPIGGVLVASQALTQRARRISPGSFAVARCSGFTGLVGAVARTGGQRLVGCYLDLLRPQGLCLGQAQVEHAVLVARFGFIGVDAHGKVERAVEGAVADLLPVVLALRV